MTSWRRRRFGGNSKKYVLEARKGSTGLELRQPSGVESGTGEGRVRGAGRTAHAEVWRWYRAFWRPVQERWEDGEGF